MDSSIIISQEMYTDVLQKYQQMKGTNIKLLEEKRGLILRLAENNNSYLRLLARFEDITSVQKSNDSRDKEEMAAAYEDSSLVARCHQLENDLLKRTSELIDAKEENIRLREQLRSVRGNSFSGCGCAGEEEDSASQRSRNCVTVDEIEALKHQLVVYQEDFNSEKTDKENALAEGRLLKGKLREAEDFIHALKQETVRYENALRGLANEKDSLKRQVRRLSSTSSLPLSPVRRTYFEMTRKDELTDNVEDDVIARNNLKPKLMRLPSEVLYDADVVRD